MHFYLISTHLIIYVLCLNVNKYKEIVLFPPTRQAAAMHAQVNNYKLHHRYK